MRPYLVMRMPAFYLYVAIDLTLLGYIALIFMQSNDLFLTLQNKDASLFSSFSSVSIFICLF